LLLIQRIYSKTPVTLAGWLHHEVAIPILLPAQIPATVSTRNHPEHFSLLSLFFTAEIQRSIAGSTK
jgi:hypothetical protein